MKTEIDGKTVRLPDFLIVGTARSGTTSLFRYLNQHPRIFIIPLKECYFFPFSGKPTSFKQYPAKVVWDFDDYVKLFESAKDEQLLGEAAGSYLYLYQDTIKNIKKHIPDWQNLRIITILRNPVHRAFSMFSLFKMTNVEPLDFQDAIKPDTINDRIENGWRTEFDYIGYGFYYEQVKAYLQTFPFVKIYLYDDFLQDTQSIVRDIFKFLNLNDFCISDIAKHHNVSGTLRFRLLDRLLQNPNLVSSIFPPIKLIPIPKQLAIIENVKRKNLKKDKMKHETRLYLRNLYRQDILKLQGLIQRDLSGWLDN